MVGLAPLGNLSEKTCEQNVEVHVPQGAELFVAPCAEHILAVPGPLIVKENVEVVSLVPYGQLPKRICEPIVAVPVPQLAEQFVARFVAVKRPGQCVCVSRSMHVCSDLNQVF